MGKASDLERLAKLRDQGVLSQDEFEQEKQKILGNNTGSPTEKKSGAVALFVTLFILFIIIGIASAFITKNILEKHKIPDDIKTTEITAQTRPDVQANQREEEKEPNRKAPSVRELYLNQEQNEPVFSDLPVKSDDDILQEKNSEDDISDGTRQDSHTEKEKTTPSEPPEKIEPEATPPQKTTPTPTQTPAPKKQVSAAVKPTPANLSPGSYSAGTDLPPGIYNIEAVSGSGTIQAGEITDGGFIGTISADPKKEGINIQHSVQNITIKPNDKVLIMNNLSVKITKTGDLPTDNTGIQ